ncbi:MAG: Secretion system C-terminal sorting domain, partial [Bacteroidota bacterium]
FHSGAAALDTPPAAPEWNNAGGSAVREMLYTGSGTAQADLKIYPNPYADKGFLEIDLKAPTRLYINMTDVNGSQAAVLLPRRALQQGFYRFELPDVKPGIYFVQCYFDERLKEVRKVVKTDAP